MKHICQPNQSKGPSHIQYSNSVRPFVQDLIDFSSFLSPPQRQPGARPSSLSIFNWHTHWTKNCIMILWSNQLISLWYLCPSQRLGTSAGRGWLLQWYHRNSRRPKKKTLRNTFFLPFIPLSLASRNFKRLCNFTVVSFMRGKIHSHATLGRNGD